MQALVGGTLIDGRGGEPLADSTILIGEDGRISSAGPRAAVAIPEGAKQLDITGNTVMPGLIDCHDHLASFTYDLMSRWGMTEPRSTRTVRIARVIEDTLQSGYTTVRDCGWLDAGFKAAVNEGLDNRAPPPRGGRTPGTDPQRAGPPNVLRASAIRDAGPQTSPSASLMGPPKSAPRSGENTRVGADLIKVFQTGFGRATHLGTDACYDLEELKILVHESHAQGKMVACHAVGGPGLRTAVGGPGGLHRARVLSGPGHRPVAYDGRQQHYSRPRP